MPALLAGSAFEETRLADAALDALAQGRAVIASADGPRVRAHAADTAIDGLELVLKGGQMGSEDFFETVRRGG